MCHPEPLCCERQQRLSRLPSIPAPNYTICKCDCFLLPAPRLQSSHLQTARRSCMLHALTFFSQSETQPILNVSAFFFLLFLKAAPFIFNCDAFNLLPDNLFTRCRALLRVCVTEYSGNRVFNWLNALSIIQTVQAAVSI